jgi:hypothetical protein
VVRVVKPTALQISHHHGDTRNAGLVLIRIHKHLRPRIKHKRAIIFEYQTPGVNTPLVERMHDWLNFREK